MKQIKLTCPVDKYEWHGEVEMLFDRVKEIKNA